MKWGDLMRSKTKLTRRIMREILIILAVGGAYFIGRELFGMRFTIVKGEKSFCSAMW